MTKITASDLLKLLAVRHSKDLFIAECKSGPSQDVPKGQLVRLDAWAMKRSWSNPHTFGYEIKVSRSDFMQDEKWHKYLDLCSHFSFVCPPGVIDRDELPQEVGLIVSTTNGCRLLTKKKAPLRDVVIPESLWRYILMCRTNITEKEFSSRNNLEFWQNWLEHRELSHDVGRRVSKSLGETILVKQYAIEQENASLQMKIEGLQKVERLCKEIGVNPSSWLGKSDLERQLSKSQSPLPAGLAPAVSQARQSLDRIARMIGLTEVEI